MFSNSGKRRKEEQQNGSNSFLEFTTWNKKQKKVPIPPTEEKAKTTQSSTCDLLKNFKEGDLLFGLTKGYRDTLLAELRKQQLTYVIANDLNGSIVQSVIENGNNDFPELHISQHFDFLKQHVNYLTKNGGRPIPLHKDYFPSVGVAIRRACKLLVRTANQDRKVHFELDRISVKKICDNDPTDLGVTNSEIKAAYRLYKAGKPNPYILFYKKGEACAAPWEQEENKMHWENYDKKREMKSKK